MVLKITRLLMMLVLFTDIQVKNPFDYGIVHKNNLSDNTIQLIIYIQNNNLQEINPGTVYDISINEYEGEFTVARTIRKNCIGKGIIYIYGDLSEDRFKKHI